jgi:hypothetical protein
MSEEHRLGVSKNRVLGKIFGSRRQEIVGDRRVSRKEEIHAVYPSPDTVLLD